jgi:hypothetical protein
MTNGDKVYIVTEGEYSDYHIIAVFATREEAEKLVKFLNTDAEIEEYTLGVRFDLNTNRKLFKVIVWYDRSAKSSIYTFSCYKVIENPYFTVDYVHDEPTITSTSRKWDGNSIGYHVSLLADDEDHAVKIAIDAVAKYRAQEEGL